jgi:transcriptional regulator with XRE-family HTH domain
VDANDAPRRAFRIFLATKDTTQQAVAERMGVSAGLISFVLSGARVPSPSFLVRFRNATHINLKKFPRDASGRLTGAPIPLKRPSPEAPDPHPLPPEPEATRAT